MKFVAGAIICLLAAVACGAAPVATSPSPTPSAPGLLNDTWTWDGGHWRMAGAGGPPARIGASLAFDPVHGALILFGGSGSDGLLSDTWSWAGTRWTELHPAHHPLDRQDAAAVFDPVLNRILLFGGLARDQSEGAVSNETWSWDGTDWQQLHPRSSPSARSGSAIVYDRATRTVVLFGGQVGNVRYFDDTWSWDGATWTLLKPGWRPPPRAAAAIAFDARTGEVVIFGGAAHAEGGPGQIGVPLGDTWTWTGGAWTTGPVSFTPGARLGAVMAPDVSGDRLLMLGGVMCPALDPSLYAWSSGAWSVVNTAGGPRARSGMSMAFDAARRQVVLFGGSAERTCFSGG